jgi:hypothetical protein
VWHKRSRPPPQPLYPASTVNWQVCLSVTDKKSAHLSCPQFAGEGAVHSYLQPILCQTLVLPNKDVGWHRQRKEIQIMYQNRVSLIGSGIENNVAAESLDNVGAWICMQDSGERTLGDQLTNAGCAQRGQGQFGGVEEPGSL